MIIDTANYGLCLFSPSSMKSFLTKRGKSRKRRLLDLFQDDKQLYLDSLSQGIWIPIIPIPAIEYKIELNDEIDSKSDFIYSGFNIYIEENDLWLCDIGKINKIDYSTYLNNNCIYYYTLDNKKIVNGIRLPVESGKYLVTISGYVECDTPHFSFKLEQIDNFSDYKDPREDKYTYFKI